MAEDKTDDKMCEADKKDGVSIIFEKKTEVEPFLINDESAPEDRNSLVYLIILLHGIGTLMPWNMFITIAKTYYEDYKMMSKGDDSVLQSTVYSEQYMSAQNICSQLPNLLLNLINIFIVVKGDLTKRIGVSLCVVGFCILLTMSFIYSNTWDWLAGFFVLTLVIIILLNGANGVYQNSIYGLVSDFPFKYTNAVIIGNNFCGTFVTILNIVSITLFSDVRMQAMLYFGLSLLTIAACFCSFFTLKKLPFYRHYTSKGGKIVKDDEETYALHKGSTDEAANGVTVAEFFATFKEGWVGFTNVFLIFFVTLSIFPQTMLNVVPLDNDPFFKFIGANLFHSVVTFLLFNVLAFIGSMLASYRQIIHHENLRYFVYGRLLLIPAFIFLNYRPGNRGSLPILCNSSILFVLLAAMMAISSGYLSSLAMMFTPRFVSPSRGRIAMMMAAFFLISGIVGGILFSKFLIIFVSLF